MKQREIVGQFNFFATKHTWLFVASLVLMLLSGIVNILPSWLIKVSMDGLNAMNTGLNQFCVLPQQIETLIINWTKNHQLLSQYYFQIKSYFYFRTDNFAIILPLLIICIFTLDAMLKFIYLLTVRTWGLRIIKDIRDTFHSHVLKLNFKYLDNREKSTLVSVVSSDLQSLQSWLAESITNFFNEGFKALALFGWLLAINYKLTLLSLATIPLFAIPVAKLGKRIRQYSKSGQDAIGLVSGFVNESLVNQKILRSFNLEEYRQKLFLEQSNELYKQQSKWFFFMSLVSPITNIVGAVGISVIFYFGLQSVIANEISLGEFSSFFVTAILLYDPVKRLGRVITIIQSSFGVAERVFEILQEDIDHDSKNRSVLLVHEDHEKNAKIEVQLNANDHSISVCNVHFEYSSDLPVFKNLNLHIPDKACVAIIGKSGSGKSTLVKLLLRFYEIQAGSIFLGSVNIQALSSYNLRNNIAYMDQDPQLFNGTIRQNIQLGLIAKTLSNKEFDTIIDKVRLRELINDLPMGLDTNVGEFGQNLSIGQKQRIALARTLVSNKPIIILDEPTSALDDESQQHIVDTILQLKGSCTIIIIAHRLDTIMNCDLVFDLDKM